MRVSGDVCVWWMVEFKELLFMVLYRLGLRKDAVEVFV